MRIVHTAIVIIAVLMLAAALWCTVNLTSRQPASSMRGASEPAASAITTNPRRLHQPLIHRTRQDSDPYQTTRHHQEEEDTDAEDFQEDHNFDRRIGRNIRSVSSYNYDMRLARRSHLGSLRAIQKYLRETNEPLDCCPTVEQLVEPVGARDLDGMYVTLYRDGNITQRFFEKSCSEEVNGQPCKFVHTKLAAQSKCVQKYIYVYAIVQDHKSETSTASIPDRQRPKKHVARSGLGVEEYKKHQFHSLPGPSNGSGWRLDYIMVRSGCSCEIGKKGRYDNRSTSQHNSD